MLLIRVYIVYNDVFVGVAVVFDQVDQLFKFAVWHHLVSFINKLFSKCSKVSTILIEFKVLDRGECFSLMSTNVPISH